ENGRVMMDGEAAELAQNEDVKEFYLGVSSGERKSFRDTKFYRRRKRWLAGEGHHDDVLRGGRKACRRRTGTREVRAAPRSTGTRQATGARHCATAAGHRIRRYPRPRFAGAGPGDPQERVAAGTAGATRR